MQSNSESYSFYSLFDSKMNSKHKIWRHLGRQTHHSLELLTIIIDEIQLRFEENWHSIVIWNEINSIIKFRSFLKLWIFSFNHTIIPSNNTIKFYIELIRNSQEFSSIHIKWSFLRKNSLNISLFNLYEGLIQKFIWIESQTMHIKSSNFSSSDMVPGKKL